MKEAAPTLTKCSRFPLTDKCQKGKCSINMIPYAAFPFKRLPENKKGEEKI